MSDTAWLADRLPYGYFTDEGEIRLRHGGLLCGYEIHGLSLEASSADDIAAACERLQAALVHLGTNDMLHVVYRNERAHNRTPELR